MGQFYAYYVLTGMTLLLSWGIACILYGLPSRGQPDSIKKFCREMTLYWGVINTIIGIFAVMTVLAKFDSYNTDLSVQQHALRVFRFNVGLDLIYSVVGLVIAYAGQHISAKRRGYGLAILVQGGFLFVIDGVLSVML